MRIVMGCDNAAFRLKEIIKEFLREKGIQVEDLGCESQEDLTAYPLIAQRVCERIQESGGTLRGLLFCGTGLGMCITANKFKGIRAGVCHDIYSAERSVLSNDANVLCMGARVIGEELAKRIIDCWLSLTFRDGPSTSKIREIAKIEEQNLV